jgi:hypothetical protein
VPQRTAESFGSVEPSDCQAGTRIPRYPRDLSVNKTGLFSRAARRVRNRVSDAFDYVK